MLAYYVKKNEEAFIIVPETDQVITGDPENLKRFVSPSPCFKAWIGMHHEDVKPEEFGEIIATRDDEGDVSVKNEDVWRKDIICCF